MSNATLRLLIAEDETPVRQYLRRALSPLSPNLELIEAADGRTALEIFQTIPLDLILCDQRMPLMSGLELLHHVRAASDLPFIFLSADHSIAASALALGATAFLYKPITLNELRTAVSNALHLPRIAPQHPTQHPALTIHEFALIH